MTDELQDLARRAVACPAWRWVPGMVITSDRWPYRGGYGGIHPRARVVNVDTRCTPAEVEFSWGYDCNDGGDPVRFGCLPDFADPLTVLALLLLVREAWRDEGIAVRGVWEGPGLRHWHVEAGGAHGAEFAQLDGAHSSEAAALVAALEAAPVPS